MREHWSDLRHLSWFLGKQLLNLKAGISEENERKERRNTQRIAQSPWSWKKGSGMQKILYRYYLDGMGSAVTSQSIPVLSRVKSIRFLFTTAMIRTTPLLIRTLILLFKYYSTFWVTFYLNGRLFYFYLFYFNFYFQFYLLLPFLILILILILIFSSPCRPHSRL